MKIRRIIDLTRILEPFPGPKPKANLLEKMPPNHVEDAKNKVDLLRKFVLDPFDFMPDAKPITQEQWLSREEPERAPFWYITICSDPLGAHIEGPPEWYRNSDQYLKGIAGLPLEKCVGDAAILDLTDITVKRKITAEDLKEAGKHVRRGDIVLIKTKYSDSCYGRADYFDRSPYFSSDAAQWLINKRIKLLGFDFPSPDEQKPSTGNYMVREKQPFHIHAMLWETYEIPILEDLMGLDQIKKKRAFILALPLKFSTIHSAPARVIAIEFK